MKTRSALDAFCRLSSPSCSICLKLHVVLLVIGRSEQRVSMWRSGDLETVTPVRGGNGSVMLSSLTFSSHSWRRTRTGRQGTLDPSYHSQEHPNMSGDDVIRASAQTTANVTNGSMDTSTTFTTSDETERRPKGKNSSLYTALLETRTHRASSTDLTETCCGQTSPSPQGHSQSNTTLSHTKSFTTAPSTAGMNVTGTTLQTGTPFPEADVKLYLMNCSARDNVTAFGRRGRIRGAFEEGYGETRYPDVCEWSIRIPEEFRYLFVLLTLPEDPCIGNYVVRTGSSPEYVDRNVPRDQVWMTTCKIKYRQVFLERQFYYFVIYDDKTRAKLPKILPRFTIEFEAFNEDVRKRLEVTYETPNSGYITQWGYDGIKNYLCVNDASHELKVPEDHVVMISFARFHMNDPWADCPNAGLWLYSVQSKDSRDQLLHVCGSKAVRPVVFSFSLILFRFKTQLYCNYVGFGFKAYFSFHPISQTPPKLNSLMYNCSTPNYEYFKKHLDCNLEYECVGFEDEGEHCPYSSPRCNGLVSAGIKCYQLMVWPYPISAYAAQSECAKLNGDLAMMKTKSEWDAMKQIFQYGKRFELATIGVRTGDSSFPPMYRYMVKWMDNTIAHGVNVMSYTEIRVSYHKEYELCAVFHFHQKLEIIFDLCIDDLHRNFICQMIVEYDNTSAAEFPATSLLEVANVTQQRLFVCADGHVTHGFLSCDPASRCRSDGKYQRQCRYRPDATRRSGYVVMSMFVCDDRSVTVPYTLVCDFRRDCQDGSDETFCRHDDGCQGFRCQSGQCVSEDQRCDWVKDCLDESDEETCEDIMHPRSSRFLFPQLIREPPPVALDFSSSGHLTQRPLRNSESCNSTHFQCAAERYCLPVYLYCNGIADCPRGSDEKECHRRKCPGFYRCRSSAVCVHVEHLCDGWSQCPQHDDEWLCQAACPERCLCQGHSFRCPQSFSSTDFPHLRYLDAADSGMKTRDVTGMLYLIWLSLARCDLVEVSVMDLPNLRSLDLSQNQLVSLHLEVFLSLENLRTLVLSYNQLNYISAGNTDRQQTQLNHLDLSLNYLNTFASENISCFPKIEHLNISSSKISIVPKSGFSGMFHLKEVDLRGNLLKTYPQGIFKELDQLQSVFAADYRLCCQQNLPEGFQTAHCQSPRTHLSSCEDLLRYVEHRAVLSVVMALCLVGNMACLVLKLCVKRNAISSPIDLLMTNLSLMDLLMGAYTLIIVVVDLSYRDRYFSIRHQWTASFTCKLASILSSVSYQAPAFLLCFVTLHGYLTASSQTLTTTVTTRSAVVVSVAVWVVTVVINLLPLLEPEWKVHGHTDTCIVLPTTVDSRAGRAYAFAVVVVLQLILSFLIFIGQVLLHWEQYSHEDWSLSITEKALQVAEATQAFPIITLDCVRRLAFSLLGVLAETRYGLPRYLHVVLAMFMVPVCSALNPLLYSVNVVLQKRRQASQQLLLQRLQRKLVLQKSVK